MSCAGSSLSWFIRERTESPRPMAQLIIFCFVCTISTAYATVAEYQLESQPLLPCELAREKSLTAGDPYIPQCSEEGLYRNIQCERNGASCWCVDTEGAEVPGSKVTDSPATCLSFCQLKKQQILLGGYLNSSSTSFIPRCKDSGDYEPVQCDQQLGECWCVDSEGMEIYGTRQMGAPLQCPQSCAVRDRRILHDVGEKNPPQCGKDGRFQPVQCKLVNTTDQMVFDVVTGFSRFPEIFKSFKSLKESFPEVSGYCYCADALGRELEGTGLEMLLDEIYDTVFSGLSPSRSFPETAIYRMLQRRFLGVQLITSGRFRCPTACEIQRFASAEKGDVYVPACEIDGGYNSAQCQEGGQCWCVDSKGREIAGSRTAGETPKCDNFDDCTTRRRQALSTLFYGPVGHFSQKSLFFTQEEELGARISSTFCPSYLVETFLNSGVLDDAGQNAENLRIQLRTFLSDTILGIFTSKKQVEFALQFTSDPIKFQQTLFGGKFLKNLGSFNFTGTVGTNSKFSFSNLFQQIGLTGTYSGGNFKELAKLFSSEEDSYLTNDPSNSSKPDFNLNQSILSSFGRTVNLRENRNHVEFLESILERKEFATFLQDVVSIPPSVAEDIFEAVKILVESEACEKRPDGVFVPTCTRDGKYEEIQCSTSECWCVDEQGREVQGTRTQEQQPTCSSKCLRERKSQIAFQRSQSAGSDVYIPACDQRGNYLTVQCAGKNCFCVDLEGKNIPGTQKLSGENIQCPSFCQLAAGNAFLQVTRSLLSVPTPPLDTIQVYIPQCSPEGEWRATQCSGPTEQTFELYETWTKQTGTVSFSDTLKVILKYKESSSQRFSDFVQTLYDGGHQNVFPAFSQYSLFSDIPQEILEGNLTKLSPDNVFLNPYVVWRLMSGSLSYYPGSYNDFSTPLGHRDIRSCWCVNMDGEKLEGTEMPPNKVPKCPGSCQLAKLKTSQFLEDARSIIAASNSSHFPLAYNVLVANGLRLSERDLLYTQDQKSVIVLSEKFLSKDAYGLKLAAYSTLQFFWQSGANSRQTTQLSYLPYSPQCDGLRNWDPVQFYQGTGHYWCVDDEGSYVPGSLGTRTSGPPQCRTSCQQAQANSLISNWMPKKSATTKTGTSNPYMPRCTESGQYAALQQSETESWCVHPINGRVVLQDFGGLENITCPGFCAIGQSTNNFLGEQLIPSCDENGKPPRELCDPETRQCVCVFEHGEEAEGTQAAMSEKPGATCQAPLCPLPFGAQDIQRGSIFCEESGETLQSCRVLCHAGYIDTFPGSIFTCDPKTQRWTSPPPHARACQRLESFQTAQTRAQFQLVLPPGKMCMGDYAGVLQAFQSLILDDLKSRGLCNVQITRFESSGEGRLSLCDDSTVRVECLSSNQLGVNITWTAQTQEIPESSLPSLHDIEAALAARDLVGRLLSLVRTGSYSLNLDSKVFVAEKSDFLPEDAASVVTLGCANGFQKVLNSRTEGLRDVGGCGICPAGSYSVDGECTPCPVGSYQEKAGTSECMRCPLGTTTLYAGAYSRSHCVTSCQKNERGLRCDDRGQFRLSQRDATTNKYFCADNSGEKLIWTETDVELTEDQCSLFRRFDLVPEGSLLVSNEDSSAALSGKVKEKRGKLFDCFLDCAMDEECDYLTVWTNGTGVICQLQSRDGANIMCTTDSQIPDALGNSASSSMDGLKCQYKIKLMTEDNVAVYRKRGHEFGDHRDFTRTDFTNTFTGVYSAAMFPSRGGAKLTDGYLMCRQMCTQDSCCDGFILTQVILNQGTTICALLRSPDTLLCNVNDWSRTSRLGGDGICKGVKSNPEQKKFSFFLGGQEFSGSYALLSQSIGMADYSLKLSDEMKLEIQELFFGFKRVFLRQDSKKTQLSVTGCLQVNNSANVTSASAAAMERFLPVSGEDVVISRDIIVGNIEYWVSKARYSSDQALAWCLTRCLEEESWCRLADLRDRTAEYFSCLIYPDTWNCNNLTVPAPDHCDIALNTKPQSLHHRRETLSNTVKHFYILLPYRTVTAVSVRNRITVTGQSVSKGFFRCELLCDADPCCKGFGYIQQAGISGLERICLLVSSLGIQSCAEQDGDSWRVSNCSLRSKGMEALPFGWYQKPAADQKTTTASLCPSSNTAPDSESKVSLDSWITVDSSSISLDPSLSRYDTVQIDLNSVVSLSSAQSYCLSECDRAASCVTTTISVQQTALKCTFYPETQTCHYSLRGPRCQLLIREPATLIYRKKAPVHPVTSLTISQGGIVGKPESIFIGSDIKNVNQFLGIPYAAPPTGENRFRPPQPYTWTGTWNATFIRPSCLQPGDGKAQYGSVSEDCLYLNLFVPQNSRMNSPVLLYFHNSPKDYAENGQTFVDGSYLAAIGDIMVVIASYRVGVFGFLSPGNTVPNGNWGLLDQTAALTWVQENIAYFGGDPEQISVIADRAGADLASIHLLLPEAKPIKRAALMGGSAFSPMLPVSARRAQQQVESLSKEVGCPLTGSEETLSCLRKVDANDLNAAQTKLLAVQGPFQTWGPVVDGVYLQDTMSNLLQQKTSQRIDLLIGSSEHDGLVSRSMAIKRFEEAEGRGESKMAFYQALQNSLGGEEMNPLVQGAAAWYYSLQHSSDEYAVFSRALENATRDHFIACPVVQMAERWSEVGRGRVYMYYVPETYSQGSSRLDLPEEIIYAFGIPFHSNYRNQFSMDEQTLSLQLMQYLANFVRTGNPNFPYNFSRRRSVALPPWPEHRARISGERYKEVSRLLPNLQGLKKAECSFWSRLIPALKSSASLQVGSGSSINSTQSGLPSAGSGASRKEDKGSYA